MKYFEFDKKYILRFPNIENQKNELQKTTQGGTRELWVELQLSTETKDSQGMRERCCTIFLDLDLSLSMISWNKMQ